MFTPPAPAKSNFDPNLRYEIQRNIASLQQQIGASQAGNYLDELVLSVRGQQDKSLDLARKLALVLEMRGSYYKKQEQYEEAFADFFEACFLLGSHELPPQDVAQLEVQLADVCEMNADHAQALEWYQRALSKYGKEVDEFRMDLIVLHNNMAMIYKLLDDKQHAFEQYTKAIELCNGAEDLRDSTVLGDLLFNQACLCEAMQNTAQALELHERALQVRQHCLAGDDEDLGMSYAASALLQSFIAANEQSLEYFDKAAQILGEKEFFDAQLYRHIVQAYRQLGSRLNNELHLAKAEALLESLGGN